MLASAVPRAVDSSFEHYQPLSKIQKQIRLLLVEPGKGSDIVRGWFRPATLDYETIPEYETISYCWGDAKIRDHMIVNGHLINVPASSTAALRRMRWPDTYRSLWIDAVCINQSDVQERSAQVSAMDLVYSLAKGNLIYLGPENDECSDGAVQTLQVICRSIDEHVRKLDISVEDRRRWEAYGNNFDDPIFHFVLSKGAYDSIRPLYDLPWFQRLWVLQEVVLASRNTCFWGSNTFDLTMALKLTQPMMSTGFGHSPGFFGAHTMLSLLRNLHVHKVPRLNRCNDLRIGSHQMRATEPRDHVFALFGLLQREQGISDIPPLIRPDYEKSVEIVFRDATRYVLNETTVKRAFTIDPLDAICHRSQEDLTANNMTSWTLKWNREHNPDLDSIPAYHWSSMAAGIPPHSEDPSAYLCSIAPPVDMDVLTLKGTFVGDIEWSAPPLVEEYVCGPPPHVVTHIPAQFNLSDPRHMLAVINFMLNVVALGPYKSQDVDDITAEVLTATISNLSNGTFPAFDATRYKKVDGLKELKDFLRDTGTLPPLPMMIDRPQDLPYRGMVCIMFWSIMRNLARNKCFFNIATGHVGIGPKILQRGDHIAAIHGKRPLFVLRPVGMQYRIIGGAIIHGLMDGEVFDMGLPSEWIDIR